MKLFVCLFVAALAFAQAPCTPPVSTWTSIDIGSPLAPGMFWGADGTYRINGSGQGFSPTGDQYHFAYLPITGDGSIVAHMANPPYYGLVGIAMRQDLTPTSPVVVLALQAGEADLIARRVPGTPTDGQSFAPSHWIKLVRRGDTITGYIGPDGWNWIEIYGQSVTFPATPTIYVGLMATTLADYLFPVFFPPVFDHVQVGIGN